MRTPTLDNVLSRLAGVRENGHGWEAKCPSHDDKNPSLAVSTGDDGRVVLHCFAGCTPESVCEAIGLRVADLFADGDTTSGNGRGKPCEKFSQGSAKRNAKVKKAHANLVLAERAAAWSIEQRQKDEGQEVGCTYVNRWSYQNEHESEVFRVIRFATPNGKTLRPLHLDDDGWRVGLPDVRPLPLLGLAGVLTSEPGETVFVVEGEACFDAATAIGLTACTSGGSTSAGRADWTVLAGRECVILPDADEPGAKYAERVASILTGLTPAAKVRVLSPLGDGDGYDLADFVRDAGECTDVADIIIGMAAGTACYKPRTPRVNQNDKGEKRPPQIAVTCLHDVEPKAVEWLWQDRFPAGMLSVISGDPGSGKSTLLTDMASRISKGRPWPDRMDETNPAGDVILLAAEDGVADTIRVRVDNANGDPKRIFILDGVRHVEHPEIVDTFQIERDVLLLDDLLTSKPQCRMIGIDPLDCFLGSRVDHNDKAQIQTALAGLTEIAERHGVAIVGVLHLRKSAADTKALYRTLGSVGFVSAPRAVWMLTRDRQERPKRILSCVKLSVAPDPQGLAFTIEDAGVIHWRADPVTKTADEVLADERPNQGTKRKAAKQWLLETLAAGPIDSTKLIELGKAEGYGRNTLFTAKDDLDGTVRARQIGGGWQWQIADECIVPDAGKDSKRTDP